MNRGAMNSTVDAPASSEQELISKLMSKVSEQALELSELSAQLEMSRQILVEESFAAQVRSPCAERGQTPSEQLKSSLSASVSDAAVQRRLEKDHNMQLLALQRQLELTESKLTEHIKSKKKLLQDLDAKTREASFYVKKCQDLQLENQQLRHQVEQTLKMTSVTAKVRGVKQPLKSVDSITYFKACDELKQAQSTAEQLRKDLESSRERESQNRMRVKVLEEALEFRSEEIGLAGHSDLLAKVAKLRGEVSALKAELTNKHQRIAEAEHTKADISDRHETLQRHVAQLQQRLSQSQQEMYRLQNGDVGELLRQAEAERDRLLKFVQSDMQKSSELAKHVERLEEQLRAARRGESTATEAVSRIQSVLDTEVAKYSQLEERYAAAVTQAKELQQAHQAAEAEKTALTNQFNRKSTEADELNRMQMTLFVQNQAKDEELKRKSEEVQQLRQQLRELQSSAPSLQSENERLRERLKFVQDEVNILRDSVNVLEPKLARLEPELNVLRSERDSWHTERQQLDAELNRLRPVGRLLVDLSSELQELNELAARAGHGAGGSGGGHSSPGSASPTGSRASLFDQGTSLSQRHSLWVGLPSLRALNSTLYENIRRLAQDLHAKETHCSELVGKLRQVTTEMETTTKSNETQWQQLTRQHEASAQTIQRLSELVSSTERELNTLRSHRITVDQIRSVLASYPGKFLEQKLYELVYGATAGIAGSGDASFGGSGGSVASVDDYHTEAKRSEPYTPLHHASTHTPAVSDSHLRTPPATGAGRRESLEAMLNKVSDHALPDLIGRAIMHNANAVIELQNVTEKLQHLEQEHTRLGAEHAALTRMQVDYDALVHEQQERLTSGEARLEALQRECFEKVDSATELAEKQNALTMTLEAKIEKLQRDKQLRTAQLTAMQQREESFRVRLQQTLQDYCVRVKIAAPPEGCKLVDLLHYNAEILRSRTGTVLDTNIYYGAGGLTGNRSDSSPGPRKGLSGTESAGKVKSSRSVGSATKRSSSHGGGGKRSQSSSPEESGGKSSKHDIVSRLSPAAQRFVTESSEFASSTAAVRRLPSPVVNRVRYDSSFNTVRSPSVDSTMHRSFAVTSIDDLATSRLSVRSLPNPTLAPSSSTGAASASISRRLDSASGGSQTVSSSSAALQERLREAQRAFAAMREKQSY